MVVLSKLQNILYSVSDTDIFTKTLHIFKTKIFLSFLIPTRQARNEHHYIKIKVVLYSFHPEMYSELIISWTFSQTIIFFLNLTRLNKHWNYFLLKSVSKVGYNCGKLNTNNFLNLPVSSCAGFGPFASLYFLWKWCLCQRHFNMRSCCRSTLFVFTSCEQQYFLS